MKYKHFNPEWFSKISMNCSTSLRNLSKIHQESKEICSNVLGESLHIRAWSKEEEEVYDGWSTASCFAYSKYSKAAFWGKTQLTSKTDQWAGPNTFHRPSVRKKETAWGPQTYARASSSYRISIHRIMRSWTSAEMVYKLTNAKHGICLQRAQKADLSYQTEPFFTKHWVIEMSNHHPLGPIID